MAGKNNFRGYDEEEVLILESSRYTYLAGLDITLLWEPVRQAKYRSFLWRSELYYASKKELDGNIKALGGYTYGEYKFDRRWHAGLRFDYTQPFEFGNSDLYNYQIVPYITWWQSPWVKLRLQYNYLNGKNFDKDYHTLRFQIVWAVGPHKHDRY
jgi:hypothetical protein